MSVQKSFSIDFSGSWSRRYRSPTTIGHQRRLTVFLSGKAASFPRFPVDAVRILMFNQDHAACGKSAVCRFHKMSLRRCGVILVDQSAARERFQANRPSSEEWRARKMLSNPVCLWPRAFVASPEVTRVQSPGLALVEAISSTTLFLRELARVKRELRHNRLKLDSILLRKCGRWFLSGCSSR